MRVALALLAAVSGRATPLAPLTALTASPAFGDGDDAFDLNTLEWRPRTLYGLVESFNLSWSPLTHQNFRAPAMDTPVDAAVGDGDVLVSDNSTISIVELNPVGQTSPRHLISALCQQQEFKVRAQSLCSVISASGSIPCVDLQRP